MWTMWVGTSPNSMCVLPQNISYMKRTANLIDASLPRPPTVAVFTEELLQWQQRMKDTAGPDPLHGEMFAAPARPTGTVKSEHAAVKCFLEFAQFCNHKDVQYHDLDQMFLGWARWVINPRELFQDAQQQEQCRARRREQAGQDFRVWAMPCMSFRTYVNAVARVFLRCSHGDIATPAIVPSSAKQFPQFNDFMRQTITAARAQRAIGWRAVEPNDTLQPSELLRVVATVDPRNVLDVQRRNILCIAYATGFRSEV